jgi:hypothetical protein
MNIEMLEKIAKNIPVASKAGIRPSVPELMPFLIEFLKEYEQSKQNKELDELKAHCEKLRNCLMKASAMDPDRIGFEKCLGKTLASTPQQSLAEIKEQAIEEYEQSKWVRFDYKDQSTWPEHGDSVLVLIDKGFLKEIGALEKAYFADFMTKDFYCDFDVYYCDEASGYFAVTHWQPLPEILKDSKEK